MGRYKMINIPTPQEREERYQKAKIAYQDIKPKVEEEFGLKLDCPIREMTLEDIARLALPNRERSTKELEDKAASSDSMYFYAPLSKREILVNTYNPDFSEYDVCYEMFSCHELLHDVFFANLICEMPDLLNLPWGTITLSEGFSEYGSLHLFSSLYHKENTGIQKRTEYNQNLRFKYRGIGSNDSSIILYFSQHAMGYQLFLEALGVDASKEDLVKFVMQDCFKKEARKETLRDYVLHKFRSNVRQVSDIQFLELGILDQRIKDLPIKGAEIDESFDDIIKKTKTDALVLDIEFSS